MNQVLNGERDAMEVAEALKIIADSIENGESSDIVGLSDIAWYLEE